MINGFDNASIARHFPAFTTTNLDFEAMGEVASEMLLDAIDGENAPTQVYILPVPLLVRTPAEPQPAGSRSIGMALAAASWPTSFLPDLTKV